jgi:UDP-N-acetylmuramoyl-tripeptide--D-alanyl-D-alanine ligase
MIPLPLGEIARVTGGRLTDGALDNVVVTGPVTIDSRNIEPGALFVAVKGDVHDGHDFAADAVKAGAVAALTTRPVGVPAVVVTDVQAALAALARHVLDVVAPHVVGVTGSSGKTSTKDLLAAVFAAAGPTVAPQNSFNNELGLPLTVLRLTEQTRTLVLEYSARGRGHIAYLCGIAPPSIGIVLNVGDAHLGEFGSRAGIAVAKGELVEALPADGVAVLNADDELVAGMASRTSARVLTFGRGGDATVQIGEVALDELARPGFDLHTPAGTAHVQLQLPGAHQAGNAAAVVAAALAAGLPLHDVVEALSATRDISAHRMQLRARADGLLVLDDAYNANPESVRAALRALRTISRPDGRRWVVLGPMRELGPDSEQMHRDIGVFATEQEVDELIVVGADAASIAAAAVGVNGWAGRARRVDDFRAAAELLVHEVDPKDIVLVKASNSERLWRTADLLIADAEVGAGAG